MSHRAPEGTVKFGELDDIAVDVARYMKSKGVPSTMAANVLIYAYAKCVTIGDIDEEQVIGHFRELLKQLRVLRPS